MADGDEASVTPPTPPHAPIGEPSYDASQMGHQNLLMLQHMTGMLKDAMTQNRLETEHAMTQNRLSIEQMINQRLASRSGEGPTLIPETNMGGEERTDERTSPTRTDKVSFKTFKTSGAIEFAGVIDPIKAFDWIKNTEKIFRISHCAVADRVPYATAMLTGPALDWWDGIYCSVGEIQAQSFTWEAFKERFMKKYCPTDLQDKYASEFLELKQGRMDVTTYLAEFNKKARFATEYVTTEARRVQRFVDGLRIEIRENLDGRGILTLDEAAELARRREHILTIRDAEIMAPPKRARNDYSAPPSSFTRYSGSGRNFSNNQSQSRSHSAQQVRHE